MRWNPTVVERRNEGGLERVRVEYRQPGGTRWARLEYRLRRRPDPDEHERVVAATIAAEARRLAALWAYAPTLRTAPPAPDPDPLHAVQARIEGWGLVPTQGVLRARVAVTTPEALCRAWWELVHPASAAEDWLAWLADLRTRVDELRRLWGPRGWPAKASQAGLRVLAPLPHRPEEVV